MPNHEPDSKKAAEVATLNLVAEARDDRAEQELIELVRRGRLGDQTAIATLVTRILPDVRSAIRRRLGSRSAQSDVARLTDDYAQEVFLRLFANDAQVLRRWDPERGLSLGAFVALIADRWVISELRVRRATDQCCDILDHAEVLASNEEQPDDWVANRESLLLLVRLMTEKLSPLGRRIFHLLYVEEQSVSDICSLTGIGVDAVYAWRSRLRKHANQVLQVWDDANPGRAT